MTKAEELFERQTKKIERWVKKERQKAPQWVVEFWRELEKKEKTLFSRIDEFPQELTKRVTLLENQVKDAVLWERLRRIEKALNLTKLTPKKKEQLRKLFKFIKLAQQEGVL